MSATAQIAPLAEIPAVAATDFRAAMARLAAAVTVVTTDGPAGRFGITASAVTSVTDAPPTLLVCINRGSSLHDAVVANGTLCVNLLGDAHRGLAGRFADRALSPDERFAGAAWRACATGAPALVDAPVAFACRLAAHRDVGTHGVIFAEVVAIAVADRADALVWFDRGFHALGGAAVPTA